MAASKLHALMTRAKSKSAASKETTSTKKSLNGKVIKLNENCPAGHVGIVSSQVTEIKLMSATRSNYALYSTVPHILSLPFSL
jgi:hypothetical protein